jgi:hypothetical protein
MKGRTLKEHIEAVAAALGLKPVFGGATMSFMGWVFSSAGAAWCGAFIAFVGLLMNFYFTRKKDKREQEAHDARMKGLA